LRDTAGGLPSTYWYLWTGPLINRVGGLAPALHLIAGCERHVAAILTKPARRSAAQRAR